MKAKSAVLLLIFLITAAFTNLVPRARGPQRTEAWMESQIPPKAGDYAVGAGYKMDKLTYDTLQPFGIVSHIYADRSGHEYDVTLIASDQPRSFHDPRICFGTQGASLSEDRVVTAQSKTRGAVPVTLVKMVFNGQPTVAAYFYRGPRGFTAAPKSLFKQIFFTELLTRKPAEGVFYRFISRTPSDEKQLLSFVGTYLDAASASSNGYY
jgi:hypothetical protein